MVKPFELTERTTKYNVIKSGKVIASFGKEVAAQSFDKYVDENNINTLEQWRAQPMPVKVAFISATCMVEPLFPRK